MANEELIYRITRAVYARLGTRADEQTVEQLVTEIYREIESYLPGNGRASRNPQETSYSGLTASRGEGLSERMVISVFGLDHPGIVAGVAQMLAEAECSIRSEEHTSELQSHVNL